MPGADAFLGHMHGRNIAEFPVSFYQMKYHQIPVYSKRADESWSVRRGYLLRFVAFIAVSYTVGIASVKAATLGSILVAERLGYGNDQRAAIVRHRVNS